MTRDETPTTPLTEDPSITGGRAPEQGVGVDELIPIAFEGKLGPTDPGHIVINSDLTGEGRAIRLYGIRVLPGS